MPVRKVKLKDGSVGYQWGTSGKIYKKRKDAEKQGLAILLSQRKLRMKKNDYRLIKAKVEELEKLVNGGKGSGNFGHAGRPGEVGGSAPGGGSGKSFSSKYRVGDTYIKGGEVYRVEEGENGPMGVSFDGKVVTTLPDELRHEQTEMIRDAFDSMRDEGVPPESPRGQAAQKLYDRIQARTIEVAKKGLEATRAPKLVQEEVGRFLRAVETMGSVEAYHETAAGGLDGWAKGNSDFDKPVGENTQAEVKELIAELDSLYERYRIMTTPKGFRE